MGLVKIRFGSHEFKIDSRRVIATEVGEGFLPSDTVYCGFCIFLDGGHKIQMQLASYQDCLDMAKGIWETINLDRDAAEWLEFEMLEKQREQEIHQEVQTD